MFSFLLFIFSLLGIFFFNLKLTLFHNLEYNTPKKTTYKINYLLHMRDFSTGVSNAEDSSGVSLFFTTEDYNGRL